MDPMRMLNVKFLKLFFKIVLNIGLLTFILKIFINYFQENKNINLASKIKNEKSEKILCVVLTSDKTFIERCPTLFDTWGKKCDKILFACNCKNMTDLLKSNIGKKMVQDNDLYDKVNNLPILELDVFENYDFMARKTMVVLDNIYRNYQNDFDWFLLIDDDTFVFVENLKLFMSKKNPKEPFTYGYNFKEQIVGGYHSGGGGVLFTHEALKRIYNGIQSNKCNFSSGFGDIAIGLCSHKSGVLIGNSTDETGRERFHPLSYGMHSKGEFPEWLYKYSASILRKGKYCCSEQSITFHYTTPEEMYILNGLKNPTNLTELFRMFFK